MEMVSKSITGGSLLISGTLVLNLVMAGMDWNRIEEYGLFHELGLRGIAPLMFILGVGLMLIGIIVLIKGYKFEIDKDEVEE